MAGSGFWYDVAEEDFDRDDADDGVEGEALGMSGKGLL